MIVGQDFIVPVGGGIGRASNSDAQRAPHRKLQQFRESWAWPRVAGLKACGKRFIDRWILRLDGRWGEGYERPRDYPVPGSVVVAVFPVGAEAQPMITRCPVDIVGPLIGARVAIRRDVGGDADPHPTKQNTWIEIRFAPPATPEGEQPLPSAPYQFLLVSPRSI